LRSYANQRHLGKKKRALALPVDYEEVSGAGAVLLSCSAARLRVSVLVSPLLQANPNTVGIRSRMGIYRSARKALTIKPGGDKEHIMTASQLKVLLDSCIATMSDSGYDWVRMAIAIFLCGDSEI
jgi:hypothetical protein